MSENVYIEFNKLNSGKHELKVMVYGINLSEGRTITEKDKDKIDKLSRYVKLLNSKIDKEIEINPKFVWLTLAEWRQWATQYINEFCQEEEALISEEIRNNMSKVWK